MLNGNIFFELFLSDLDEKITSAGYERHSKGNSETGLSCPKNLPRRVSHEKQKHSLTLNNFNLSSQQLVPNYFFILAKVLTSISKRCWPNFDQIHTPSLLAAIWRSLRPVQSRGKDGMPRTTRGPSPRHRNVIGVKSIAFLRILLAPEVSFVTLHIRWHKGWCSNSIHNNYRTEYFKVREKNNKIDLTFLVVSINCVFMASWGVSERF